MGYKGHVTSSGRSPIGSPPPLSYRLSIVTFLLAPLVFEIFDLKVADKQTDRQTFTSTDNKGRLKLSAREPIGLEQNITDTAISAWRNSLHACVHAKGRHTEH